MKEIKRYVSTIYRDVSSDMFPDVKEFEHGDLVKYTDHKAVVETMQKRIEELGNISKSMECCENCKYYLLNRGITCLRPNQTDLCKKWYPLEPSAIDLWETKE